MNNRGRARGRGRGGFRGNFSQHQNQNQSDNRYQQRGEYLKICLVGLSVFLEQSLSVCPTILSSLPLGIQTF